MNKILQISYRINKFEGEKQIQQTEELELTELFSSSHNFSYSAQHSNDYLFHTVFHQYKKVF